MEAVLDFVILGNMAVVERPAPEASDPLAGLARAARAGDRIALRRLLQALGPRLLRVVKSVLGAGHPEIEDVLQDATLLVIRALDAFRGEGDVEGYAVRITLRAAITARKRYRVRHPLTESNENEAETALPPSEEALAHRQRELLRELLSEIPEPQAEALVLRTILGMTLEEAAAIAGVPENTIRSRMRLAREALRRRIEADPVLMETLEIET